MAEISVQKIPKKQATSKDYENLIARFCYKFPQYKYSEAKLLPYKRIVRMLAEARREDVRHMIELVNVVSAPHSKNGAEKVIQSYKEELNED